MCEMQNTDMSITEEKQLVVGQTHTRQERLLDSCSLFFNPSPIRLQTSSHVHKYIHQSRHTIKGIAKLKKKKLISFQNFFHLWNTNWGIDISCCAVKTVLSSFKKEEKPLKYDEINKIPMSSLWMNHSFEPHFSMHQLIELATWMMCTQINNKL